MKLIDLAKIDNERNKKYEKFTEEINKFKLENDYDFELDYPDKDHLIITIKSLEDYPEKIHDNLCEHFDVRLQYAQYLKQQAPYNKYYTGIELVYSPVHHYTTFMEYKEIKL